MQSTPLDSLKKEHFIYLTTTGRKSGKPHTVELWFASQGNRIFLSHEGQETDWIKNLTKIKQVNVRIGSARFHADGCLASNGEPRETGKKTLYEKYYGPASKEKIDDWFELSTVIELTNPTPLTS
ncbi:MAG TPA: nitroreductase family deazaflavin-dependent oxidoreductase [Terriglobales bacterium]|nr:nitroreductase family deazaflavin-dependent oxidoreductase [Terriglobales bacterium]